MSRWPKSKSPAPSVSTADGFPTSSFWTLSSEVLSTMSEGPSRGAFSTPVAVVWDVVRPLCGALRELLIEDAAFWAAENMEEKKPFCGPAAPFETFDSSSGVKVDTELDSLLGPWAAEADRTRRCEIMFPEGLTVIPVDEMEFRGLIESGESVIPSDVV